MAKTPMDPCRAVLLAQAYNRRKDGSPCWCSSSDKPPRDHSPFCNDNHAAVAKPNLMPVLVAALVACDGALTTILNQVDQQEIEDNFQEQEDAREQAREAVGKVRKVTHG